MSPLGSCDTIAGFWQYFNNIPQPDSFFASRAERRKLVGARRVDALSLFREGVRPEWEDPMNLPGGEVLFRSDRLELVQSIWYELVLAVIGNCIPVGNGEILGVRVIDKSAKSKIEYRIEVWYSEGVDAVVLMDQLRSVLSSIGAKLTFTVRNHSSTLQKTVKAKGKAAMELPAPATPLVSVC
eukprot:TRINITY_DN364_c0_g3_i2.p1 TRINITY_DN364_c0_g3~~TRINITY_DN364_c0_g3_i2.p1  ORF type:complete len:183 (-),score=36.05 TRINITY_DN364_c0_g3_i2:220-768(-)